MGDLYKFCLGFGSEGESVWYRRMSAIAVPPLVPIVFGAACDENGGGSFPFPPSQGGSLRVEDFVVSAAIGMSQGVVG